MSPPSSPRHPRSVPLTVNWYEKQFAVCGLAYFYVQLRASCESVVGALRGLKVTPVGDLVVAFPEF